MLGFEIGLSGIRTNQIGLDVTANNIANADNPGYHRQLADQTARRGVNVDNFLLGSGVQIDRIRRSFAYLVQDSIVEKQAIHSSVSRRYESAAQVEALLSPGSGAVRNQFESLYNELTELTANPSDTARRQIVIERAQAFSQELNDITSNLNRLQTNTNSLIQTQVAQANTLFKELSVVAKQIRASDFESAPPNQLLDRRDELLSEISQIVDVRLHEKPGGEFSIMAAGQRLYMGNEPIKLEAVESQGGEMQFFAKGFEGQIEFQGGSLQGLAEVTNGMISGVQKQLDSLARNFSFAFDQAHTTGINALGGFDVLQSLRAVSDVNLPLSQADADFPIQNGELFVSLTNTVTGTRTLERIAIDPNTDSLSDIATALSAIDGLHAVTNATYGTLSISSSTGIQFDFAGRLPNPPDLTGVTGTSVPTFSGQYEGAGNEPLTFSISGTGEIGASASLTVEVRNGAGELVNQVNVGSGYEPGTPVDVFEGIQLNFAPGNLNDGDTFSTHAVSDGDTADFLVALGLNTFFTGNGAGDLSVSQPILQDHRYLASSRNGDVGDSGNILRLLDSRNLRFPDLGNKTIEGFLDGIVQQVAAEVELLEQDQTNLDAQIHRLESEKASITGVDPNEEFVRLMQYQRAFEMSSRVISVTDETIQTLLSMVG